jgi:hypothetical protein
MQEDKIINPSEESRYVNNYHVNVASDVIEITKDKLENILRKYAGNISLLWSWVTPLITGCGFLLTFLTAEFKKFIGIEAPVWKAFFMFLLLLCFVWFLWSAVRAVLCRKSTSIEFLVKEISNSTNK